MSQQSHSQPQASDLETGSGSRQGGNLPRISDKFLACYGRLPSPLRNTLYWMSKKFEIESNWGRGLYIAAYMIVILMYPLHYYAYVIKPDQNCLEIDNELYATIAAVVFFNFYMLLYTPNFFKKLFSSDRSSKTAIEPDPSSKTAKESDRSSKTAIEPDPSSKTAKESDHSSKTAIESDGSKTAIEHFIFTQIPVLLMTLTVIPDLTTGTTDKIFLTTANLFLFGYILLVIGLSLTLKNATEGNAFIARAKWAKAAYNLFLYLLGGHVFGALWYSFAIDRILACWREDYFLRNKFNPQSFVCRDKHKNIGELSCPKIKQNVGEIIGFGIFDDALRSRIVGLKRQFLKKFLYCLRWGLQALSCFGQNLSPSTFIMENIFVVSVIIYSTVLFVFLIGNMQTYLTPDDKSDKEKEEKQKKSQKKEEEMPVGPVPVPIHEEMMLFQVQEPEQSTLILQRQAEEQCVSFQKLPENLKMEVINNLQLNKWRETKILYIETLFNILPEDLLRDIKIELCLPQLRKVEEFRNLGDPALKDLCYHVKLVFYLDRTLIVRAGDPINEMLFVLHGELRTHNSWVTDSLKDGGFFGKELVTSFINQAGTYSPSLPISPKTVQAFTNVEAFVLMAYDLKRIFIKHNQQQAN